MARVLYHTSVLDVEVNPEISRKKKKSVPEGNGPVPHHDEFGSGKPTMADLYRVLEERSDKSDTQLDKRVGTMRATNQRLADLQYEAQQPRPAAEADVEPEMKTRKRTEDAAADRAKHGDSSSATALDGPRSSTSFGIIAVPLLMAPEKYVVNVLVIKGPEAPKPHLPSVEVRMLSSTADGLLPAGTTSTVLKTIFLSPPL